MYYLAPSLVSTNQVSSDLSDVGIDKWHVHVISRDEAGLRRERLQSGNWFETRDLLRDGLIGALLGLAVGVVGTLLMMLLQPFGPNVPAVSYVFFAILATLFGAWVGGLIGLDSENRKLKRFREDIEMGQYLLLIYARKGMGERIKAMMQERHPEARHVATDRHLFNPFARVERRRKGGRPVAEAERQP